MLKSGLGLVFYLSRMNPDRGQIALPLYHICGIQPLSMITVNDSAREQVSKLLAEDGRPEGSFVRVGVKGGGCSGLMYELAFDHEMRDGDQAFENNGVKVVVDKKSYLYLVGTELRYSGGLNGKGFEFHNPNANRTCGCGESFSL